MFLELGPLLGGDIGVFVVGTQSPAVVQELLVALDDVAGEARDVALCGPQVQVSEQGRADVDRQLAVDDVGGEGPTEIVRGELGPGEAGFVSAISSQVRPSISSTVPGDVTARMLPRCRWNRNGMGSDQVLS